MPRGYSHIVIGAGAIGSAAAYWLAARGAERVLMLEQYDLVNTLGSSGDHSRIIRHAYHSTAYTKLTRAMFEVWKQVESESGLKLVTTTGGLDLATPGKGAAELAGYQAAMDAVGIPYERLTAEQIREAWPQWRIDDDVTGMFQAEGGLLDIRKSVSAHTSLALARGVDFLPRTKVESVSLGEGTVEVATSAGRFTADHLVVAAASWLGELMLDLGLDFNLTLSQEQVSYFASRRLAEFTPEKFPIWIYHDTEVLYGFPVYGEAGVKLARDMRGRFIASEDRVFDGDETEAAVLRGFLERHLPGAAGPALANKTCVYDMAADREFVLDTLPEHPNVAVFNGAGHAGKFASLIGQILADLMLTGSTEHDIEPFSLLRPAITDPDFVPVFRLG
ncbi:N-methyl-L-tryptophan oxidase [Arthrobacter sp. I2-34]|uniref:N-methyl-L-tryptophan oxidase n=1 Tax=Arthrobacter hankyongi TaxID=2904801 RepID=A0ABS9L4A1_9MICC|nr:N-methyl-L-tryptophan oxidase [Arthrobacter hankyongi]MCG2621393.1 N-methyl-L-tryptophan oxidase [Arthrobacter hankyongi]